MKYHYLKNYKIIITILKKSGILVRRLVYYNNKTHGLLMRKKNTPYLASVSKSKI